MTQQFENLPLHLCLNRTLMLCSFLNVDLLFLLTILPLECGNKHTDENYSSLQLSLVKLKKCIQTSYIVQKFCARKIDKNSVGRSYCAKYCRPPARWLANRAAR